MKPFSLRSNPLSKVVAGSAALIGMTFSQAVQAATYTWDAGDGVTNTWATPANWSDDLVPTFVATDTFDLSQIDIAANSISTMSAATTLGHILIGDKTTSSNSWTLATGGFLTLDNFGAGASITQTADSFGDTISGAYTLTDNLTVTNNSIGNKTLTISGLGTVGAANKTLSQNGTSATGIVALTGGLSFTAASGTTFATSGTTDVRTSIGGSTFALGSNAMAVSGSAFTLTGNITNNSAAVQTIGNSMTVSNPILQTLSTGNLVLNGNLTTGTNSTPQFYGGAAATSANSAAKITLAGTNSFSSTGNFGGVSVQRGVNLEVTGSTTISGTGTNGGLLFFNGNSTITVATGGVFAINGTTNATVGQSTVGSNVANETSKFIVNGGSAVFGPNTGLYVGNNIGTSKGEINVQSGTLTISAGSPTATDVRSFVALGKDNGIGTVNLDGGTLATGRRFLRDGSGGASAGTAVFNFNGGRLKALGNQTDWLNSATINTNQLALTTVTTGATSGNISAIDANGFNVVIKSAISGAGGFNFNSSTGTGNVTLGGANTYAGTTTVTAGTLSLSATGSIQSPAGIEVNGSTAAYSQTDATVVGPAIHITQGSLGGVGTIASASVASGAANTITGNNAGGSPLNVTGGLTFSGAATLNLTTNSLTVPVILANSLTTNAPGGVVVNATNATWENNTTYPLIGYTTFNGVPAHFTKGTITNLGGRQNATLVDTGSSIGLQISGDSPVWTGLVSGAWTTSEISSPKNWKLQGANSPTDFETNDSVLFDNNGITTSIVISAANVSPVSSTFSNGLGKDYVLTNSGGVGGIASGILIKNGAGSLTIETPNTYAGGTSITDGTLNFANASAIGTGTLTIGGTGGVVLGNTFGAPLTLATNNPVALNGDFTFSGSDPLNLGTGILTLGANHQVAVTSADLVLAGELTGAFGISKAGPGTLVLTGTNTYAGPTTVNEGTLTGTVASIKGALANNAAVVFDQAVDATFAGVISGAGSLTKTNAGKLTLAGNSPAYSGPITLSAGTLQLNAYNAAGTGLLSLDANPLVLNYGSAFGLNTTTQISGTGTITVLAGGETRLAGDMSNFTGSINIQSAGGGNSKLNIAGNVSLPTSATINVAAGATLFVSDVFTVAAAVNVSGAGNSENFGALRIDGGTLTGPVALLGNTTIGVNSGVGTISNTISGGFSLTKLRGAVLVLSGNNSYTGPTVVSAGTLRVEGSLDAASAVTVNAGTTLAGTGTVLGTVNAAGTIAPGSGGIGTLNAGTTNLTGSLAAEVDASNSDLLNIAGNVTLQAGSTLNFVELAPVAATKYLIVKYTGLRTGAFNPPVLPPRCTLVYDDTAKEIYISRPASVGFDAFMDTFTSLTSLQKVPGADPDFDGISNLVEYALAGFDPTVANSSPGTLVGGLLSFDKRGLAITNGDVSYAIQESSDLGMGDPWANAEFQDGGDPSPSISYMLPPGQPKEFARLKVVRIPAP